MFKSNTGPLRRALSAAACVAAICAGPAAAQPAPKAPSGPPPLEDFFKLPHMQKARLSPSGRWLAALSAMPDKRMGLLFLDLQGKEAPRYVGAAPPDNMAWFEWVTDDWVVFRVNDPDYRGAYGRGNGLMSVKRDGSGAKMLIAREWGIESGLRARRHLEPNHYYIGLGKPGVPEVVVGEAAYSVRNEYSHTTPKVLNVETTGVRTLDLSAPRGDSWWIDGQGRARVAVATNEGVSVTSWFDIKAGKWVQISTAPMFEQPFVPRYVDGDDTLVVDVSNADGSRDLRVFDFATGKPRADSLLKTPGFSGAVDAVALPSGQVQGLQMLVDATATVWLDPAMAKLQDRVDAKFPGSVNVLLCNPCVKPEVVVVFSYSDRDPGNYVLFEPARDKWQLLGQVRPDIDPRHMAAKQLHRIKARDGADLPVWVTMHERPANAGPAPAVVLVHGGPHARGAEWEWSAEAHFLASRGYVVIEPEFRGSTGYGVNHFRAGWKQWGHKMQDDISDALKFAAARGWADAKRACIMGASYGGYAALMGLVKDPDQYRCAVAFAAVTDPRFMYEFHWSDISSEARGYSLPVTLGDPKKDEALLIAGSPLVHVERIKAPVLLVHGARDRRVPLQSGERMADAMRKAGKSVDFVVYPDAGHGFAHDSDNFDYYRRVETFLARHLK